VVAAFATGCGDGIGPTVATMVACHGNPGPPLAPARLRSPAIAARLGRHLVREAAATSGALTDVLAGSPYRITRSGVVQIDSSDGTPADLQRPRAAFVEMSLKHPHVVRSQLVPAFAVPLSGRGDARLARRTGYLTFDAKLRAARLTGIVVTVDLRTRRVISIAGAPGAAPVKLASVLGDCKLVQERTRD
jgi:hypothetical protein